MDDELGTDRGDDGLDAALRQTLGRAAEAEASSAAAWEQLAPRLRRARRRHRAGIVGASLLVIGGISAAVVATDPIDQRSQVIVPAGRTGDPTPGTRVPSTTSIGVATTTTATTPAGTAPLPAPGADSEAAPSPTPTEPETTTGTDPPEETLTYVAPGGRATVRFAGGALTLVDHVANPGYTAEVHKAEADDVEVRFRPASGPESRIRVRIENGSVSSETE